MLCVRTGERELVIKKSRFIAYGYNIASRDEVKPIIAKLKEKHPAARHVCYGFIADEKGDDFGYDDNGEPNGTAGKPIYSALAAAGVTKSLIAVVRYFGGIKLGAGGLTRAYRASAAEFIEELGTAIATRVCEYFVSCGGDAYKKVAAVLSNVGCAAENIVYADCVTFTVTASPQTDVIAMLKPFGVKVEKTGEKYTYM